MAGIARGRLLQERKSFRRDHPVGFFARPALKQDGEADMLKWHCGIPGKKNTLWDGCCLPLIMYFTDEYPSKPPKCQLPKNFFHPNIYPSGTVCLSIINEEQDWRPALTIKHILLGIQNLLDEPNASDPAQAEAYQVFINDKDEYERKVNLEVRKYPEGQELIYWA